MTALEKMAALALDGLPQAVFVASVSAEGARNLYVNTAYTRLTGYSVADALAPSFDAAGIFAERPSLGRPPPEGTTRRVEVLTRAGNRAPALLTLRAAPEAGDDGQLRVIGTLDEQAAAASPGGAPRDETRDALLSILSHELRSPLNACTMWLDVLASAPPGESLRKAVDALKRNLSRQARTIGSISDAGKLASGTLEARAERVDLRALIERHLDAWRLLVAGKQQSLDWSASIVDAPLAVDSERLVRVLTDLIDHASDRSPSGERLTLTLESESDRLVVTLRDRGAPLTAAATAELFEPLWRSAPGRGDSRRRIGLSMAADLLARLGGELTLSPAGASNAFRVAFPRAPDISVS